MRLMFMTFPQVRDARQATRRVQLAKITEAHAEVVDAHVNKTSADLAEEVIDLMVACDGLLDLMPESVVRQAIQRVLEKNRERGYWVEGR